MTTLRELLQMAADRGMSTRAMETEIEQVAKSTGWDISLSRGTASLILSGKYKSKPSDATVRAIAHLARVPEKDAFLAAGLPTPLVPFKDELPDGVDQLSPKRRRVLLEVIRAFVEAEQLDHTLDRLMTDPVLIETARRVLEDGEKPPPGTSLARPTAEDIEQLRAHGLIPPES